MHTKLNTERLLSKKNNKTVVKEYYLFKIKSKFDKILK
jgi:hypothetical protein